MDFASGCQTVMWLQWRGKQAFTYALYSDSVALLAVKCLFLWHFTIIVIMQCRDVMSYVLAFFLILESQETIETRRTSMCKLCEQLFDVWQWDLADKNKHGKKLFRTEMSINWTTLKERKQNAEHRGVLGLEAVSLLVRRGSIHNSRTLSLPAQNLHVSQILPTSGSLLPQDRLHGLLTISFHSLHIGFLFLLFFPLFFTARRSAHIASEVLATAIMSVFPFVCPSVTRRYCVKTMAHSTVPFALSDSKMCLVM